MPSPPSSNVSDATPTTGTDDRADHLARSTSPSLSPVSKAKAAAAAADAGAMEKGETDAERGQGRRLYGVWDPAIRGDVLGMFKKMVIALLMITCVLWICLPLFWGSTWLIEVYFKRINVDVVDFDSAPPGGPLGGSGAAALVGPTVVQGLKQTLTQEIRLGYEFKDPSFYQRGIDDVIERVIDDRCWATIVINPNATSAWRQALQTGNASYDPTGSVAVYVSSARFFQVVLWFLLPMVDQSLAPLLQQASRAAVKDYLTREVIPSQNATALQLALQAPQVLGSAFGHYTNDLRPVTDWAFEAPMEAGLIYVIIFTFHLVIFHNVGRIQSGIKDKLTLTSLIGLRLLVPAVAYVFMSLWYTTIISAFQIPLTHALGHAGWLATWALNYLTLLALGLALEMAVTLLTPAFFPFFLIFWIITNISSSFLPILLMERFYRLFYWTGFYHNLEALKTIAYGARGHAYRLGVNYGALIGLTAVDVCSLSLAQWWERVREDKKADEARRAKAQGEKAEDPVDEARRVEAEEEAVRNA